MYVFIQNDHVLCTDLLQQSMIMTIYPWKSLKHHFWYLRGILVWYDTMLTEIVHPGSRQGPT